MKCNEQQIAKTIYIFSFSDVKSIDEKGITMKRKYGKFKRNICKLDKV